MSDINITVSAPTANDLLETAQNQIGLFESVIIESQKDYESSSVVLRDIKAQYKSLDERRKAITRPIDDAKKQAMALFKPALDYLANAERHIKRSMLTYQQEQERIRRAELAKAQEAARREREKLEAQAARARQKGKEERAQALEQAADEVLSTPPPVAAPPKAEGISTRTTYSAEVTDIDALIAAVAAGTVPRETLQVNQKFLNQMARALKQNLAYPGVRVVATKNMGARA